MTGRPTFTPRGGVAPDHTATIFCPRTSTCPSGTTRSRASIVTTVPSSSIPRSKGAAEALGATISASTATPSAGLMRSSYRLREQVDLAGVRVAREEDQLVAAGGLERAHVLLHRLGVRGGAPGDHVRHVAEEAVVVV